MREFTVTKNDAGQRLDRFLTKTLPLLPDALLQKHIRRKDVKVNGRPAKGDLRLCEGDLVRLYIKDELLEKPDWEKAYEKITAPKVDILYEDENILLVDKRPGVLCHGDGSREDSNTLIAHIQAHAALTGAWRPEAENAFVPALCNRIDRNTGGIVIAAKNAEALRIMNEKIRAREIDKYYLCAVFGKPRPPAGTLSGYVFKDAVKNRVFVSEKSVPGSLSAVTEYKTLKTRGLLSLVECRLVTGRTHQVRAQFAHAGWPLLGDGKYGSERMNKPYGEKGQALYSYKLHFAFQTDAGALGYLRGKTFTVGRVPFAEKYFDFREIN